MQMVCVFRTSQTVASALGVVCVRPHFSKMQRRGNQRILAFCLSGNHTAQLFMGFVQ